MIINVAICALLLLLLSFVKAQMRITFKQLIRDLRVYTSLNRMMRITELKVESGTLKTEGETFHMAPTRWIRYPIIRATLFITLLLCMMSQVN